MRLLILSTDPSILKWKSLSTKVKEINKALPSFTVEVKTTTATPLIVKGRIDHDWLNSLTKPYFNEGHDIVAFHFNTEQKKQWGILKTLRGSNPNTPDEMGDLWFVSDENTLRKGLSQFTQTLLHEVSHEFYQETKLPDLTHTWHNANPDIKGLVLSFDWTKYQPRRQAQKKEKNRLELIVEALKALLAKKPATQVKLPVNDLLPLVKRQADKVLKDMELLGLPMRITEGYRSIERQNELYAQGRTTKGNIVTKAKGGESLHQYGVAADYVFRKQGYDATNDQWLAFASIAERHGFEWGGGKDWQNAGFVDKPHIQMMKGYKLSDFINKKVDYNKYV